MFGQKFKEHRKSLGLTGYRVWKLSGVSESILYNMENERRLPTDNTLERLAAVPELKISFETLRAWRLMDEYSSTEINLACKQYKRAM